MENITEVTNTALRSDLPQRLSSQIHESEGATRRGVEQAVPVSIAGLAVHTSSEQRARELLDAFRGGTLPHMDASDVARTAIDPDATSRLAQSSSGFLERIFGNKLDGIIGMLAGHAGVSKASAATLLGLAAPMVLDAVGKEADARGLDARGLSRFLADQGRKATGALPGPLSSAVGGGLASAAPEGTAQRARGVVEEARQRVRGAVGEAQHRGERRVASTAEVLHERKPGKGIGWWLAAGLILLGLLFLLFGRRGRGPEVPAGGLEKPDTQAPVAKNPPPAEPEAPRAAEPAQPTQEKTPAEPGVAAPATAEPGGVQAATALSAATGAAALNDFLSGNAPLPGRFTIEDVEFSPASSQVTGSAILDDVARTLSAHQGAKVRLEGHADPSGDPALNQSLSQERAAAVKSYLTAHGASAAQIETAGVGAEQPVAPNDTAQGRAQNRRVDLIVLAR